MKHVLRPISNGGATPDDGRAGVASTLRANVLDLTHLTAMSVSSVGPVFSIAAALGPMIALGLYGAPIGMWLAFIPFFLSAITFRHLNRHIPHAGASYGWAVRALGPTMAVVQGWIVILAYFFSLLAIIVPAGTYTLALVAPSQVNNNLLVSLVGSAWAIFAAIPLIWGITPTIRLTFVFLISELAIIGVFFTLGFAKLWTHGAVVAPTFGWFVPTHGFNFGALVTVAVVGFTVVDGWEIDSHAAEESKARRTNPGTAGLIGLLTVTVMYVIAFLLLFSLAPLPALVAHQTNVLAYFAVLVAPAWATKVMILGVLASTASGLWLTHYILNRALYAMSRDRVIPQALGQIHPRFRTPWLLVLLTTIAEVAVTTILVNVPNVAVFFAIMLQSAGFFLATVFVLSNVAAIAYFRTVARESLHHLLLLGVLPVIAVVSMLVLIVGFLVQSSGATRLTIIVLLLLTVPFLLQARLRRRGATPIQPTQAGAYGHTEDAEADIVTLTEQQAS